MQLDKVYEPQRFEPRWAQWWIEQALFTADNTSDKPMYSLVIPPPNVTGSLHMGHMLEHTEIDASMRWRRMRGDNVLWLPGTDHAGIATQMVVERQLAAQGIRRRDLGRDAFEQKVWEWKAVSGGAILNQMKTTGASCDWSRERFTLDPGLSRAVRETFVRLYEKGLIYRGEYMVNWCPRCLTALSDLEVEHEDTASHLWHIRYPVKGQPDRFLTVATTRPETMLGDTAVALNAADPRYLDLHGHAVILPLLNREIPIVCDDMADPKFGTGVVKVTPSHDPNDFECGKRHNLPHVKVIGEEGRITEAAGPYAGLDRYEARKRIVLDLEAAGLLAKTEDYTLSAGKCQRCSTIVEPLVSKQWFARMKPLAEPAIRAVEEGRTVIEPENWRRVYFEWMRNIRDWCVSRQLWWGHRIPAWHCQDCTKVTVARTDPDTCVHCGSAQLVRDPDVLDTWFSSGLWPFSTMGWPDQTKDLAAFYPTSLMIMGFEILFFWCARMMMFGLECMGEVPFRRVFIHGIVRDAKGKKMSKTRGNTVDPLDITSKYGTDAVRMALLTSAAPGTDILWTEDKLPSSRAFANKIWNAARFLFLNMERSGVEPCIPEPPEAIQLEDRWIRTRLSEASTRIAAAIDTNRYHDAAQTAWHFFWHDFCDWYIEMKKPRFVENSGLNNDWANCLHVFESALRLLHPLMPFITEELWQRLRGAGESQPVSIALARYPEPALNDPAAAAGMEALERIVTAIRNERADRKVDPNKLIDARLFATGATRDVAEAQREIIGKIGRVNLGFLETSPNQTDFALELVVEQANEDARKARLAKEAEQLEKVIANSRRQLGDEKFLGRAPAHIVEGLRTKLAEYEQQLDNLRKTLG
ncbi:MAG: valine--tRNA ligase [Acidobacteria bacterium]|nr:valine--tRNA ligase [Acidobacteriota bacterium]